MFSEWDGHLLVGALKGKHVSKLALDGDVVRSEYPMLNELGGRVRDIEVHPDGSIYVLLQSGSLYRLHRPLSAAAPAPTGDPALIYELVCAGCHDTGAGAAPKLSDRDRWRAIDAQARDDIYRKVIEGFGEMPARGLCNICSDAHLRATTDFMLEQGAGDGS
jgi:cytochrome c5